MGGNAPTLNADVLFGNLPSNGPEVPINVDGDTKTLKALWFDAGKWYDLSGADLQLFGDDDDAPLVTVNAGAAMSEINIGNNVLLGLGMGDTYMITAGRVTNNSEGGLRFGGEVFLLGGIIHSKKTLLVGGSGATHFAGSITGVGSNNYIKTTSHQTTHLVISGTSGAALEISTESLGFLKANNSMGYGLNGFSAVVSPSGTLGFRSHGHGPALDYSSAQKIQVQGQGAVRQWGRPPVGAVYNDGGRNTFRGDITMAGDTWFGSRGDRNGGLTLTGKITGGNYSFTKVGPGLITLTNTNNEWTGPTYLNGGVLRIHPSSALPSTSSIRFNGGILELERSTNFYFYGLGSAGGQVQWDGSGGFSAFGATPQTAAFIGIGGTSIFQLPSLQWGQNGFVPIDKELLLSSRYADSLIALVNNIVAEGTVRVERGLNADAYAALLGKLMSGASNAAFNKMGLGLLMLGNTNNDYVGATRIFSGALGGYIPMTSNIELLGGVVMVGIDNNDATFTRSVGTAPGQIQWLGSLGGGFAAWSGDQTVKLNNTTSLINWEEGVFVGAGHPLKFGHYTASGTVIWDKQLGLGDGNRSIYVERGRDQSRADVVFNQTITGGVDTIINPISLTVEGDGRMDIRVNNPNLQSTVFIHGVELRLHSAGRLPSVTRIDIDQGGALTLDHLGTHNSTTGGFYNGRLNTSAVISIDSGGSLNLWGRGAGAGPSTLRIERIVTHWGAIAIDIKNHLSSSYTLIDLKALERRTYEHYVKVIGDVDTSTLNLTSNVNYVAVQNVADSAGVRFSEWGSVLYTGNVGMAVEPTYTRSDYEINDGEGGDKIIPWATVNGRDWVMPQKNGQYTYLIALPQYYTHPNTENWNLAHNVSVSAQAQLGSSRTINSLRLIGTAELNLRDRDLILNSGGLLSYGKTIITSDKGRIMGVQGETGKKTQRPFYAHVYDGTLLIDGRASIHSDYEFVKTGDGVLRLNSSVTHYFGKSLYINQGTLSLRQGRMQVGRTGFQDGVFIMSGTALELPSNSWDPIIGKGHAPNIYLSGTPYGGGAQYGGEEAILRMGGNTKLHINVFVVSNRGTIDWYGGEVGKANILWIEELRFNLPSTQLFIRNWYQYEDILLVRKYGVSERVFPQIIFEGYEDFPVLFVDYDADYWQITPFHAPEPSTYGAILGVVGIGLVTWRRRTRGRVAPDN